MVPFEGYGVPRLVFITSSMSNIVFLSCILHDVLVLFTVFAFGKSYWVLLIARSIQGAGSSCTTVSGKLTFEYFIFRYFYCDSLEVIDYEPK